MGNSCSCWPGAEDEGEGGGSGGGSGGGPPCKKVDDCGRIYFPPDVDTGPAKAAAAAGPAKAAAGPPNLSLDQLCDAIHAIRAKKGAIAEPFGYSFAAAAAWSRTAAEPYSLRETNPVWPVLCLMAAKPPVPNLPPATAEQAPVCVCFNLALAMCFDGCDGSDAVLLRCIDAAAYLQMQHVDVMRGLDGAAVAARCTRVVSECIGDLCFSNVGDVLALLSPPQRA